MAISPLLMVSPLDLPLAVLRSSSANQEELVANLRRLKNIIIGSSNRKRDLVQRPDGVERCVEALFPVSDSYKRGVSPESSPTSIRSQSLASQTLKTQ